MKKYYKISKDIYVLYGGLAACLFSDVVLRSQSNIRKFKLAERAEKYGCTKRKIRYALDKLTEAGYIERYETDGGVSEYGIGIENGLNIFEHGESITFTVELEIFSECGFLAGALFNHIHYWTTSPKNNKILNREKYCDESLEQLANKFYTTVKSIRVAMKKLVDNGYVNSVRIGFKKSNWYNLTPKGKQLILANSGQETLENYSASKVSKGEITQPRQKGQSLGQKGQIDQDKKGNHWDKKGNTYTTTLYNNNYTGLYTPPRGGGPSQQTNNLSDFDLGFDTEGWDANMIAEYKRAAMELASQKNQYTS